MASRTPRALTLLAAALLLASAAACVPMDRRSKHAIYLRDASGDCVALFGFGSIAGRATKVLAQHVESQLCEPQKGGR